MILARPTRIWIGWVGLVHLAFFYFAMFRPDLLESSAYTWATSLLPFPYWGLISLVVASLIAGAAVRRDVLLAFAALGLALPTQVVFGLSIFVLTAQGSTSAIIGSVQWWTMAVGNGCVLYAASLGRLSEDQ